MNQPIIVEKVEVQRAPEGMPIPLPVALTFFYRTSDGTLSFTVFALSDSDAEGLEQQLQNERSKRS